MQEHERRARVYRRMADLVERPGGWTQGQMSDGAAVCLLGALDRVVGPVDEELVIRNEIRGEINSRRLVLRTNIPAWNDVPWRRQRQVVRLLRRLQHRHEKLAAKDREAWLETRVAQLEAEVAHLSARVAHLEAENARLTREAGLFNLRKRAVTARDLTESSSELLELDRELDKAAEELSAARR